MTVVDDSSLLHRFVETRSEEAFAEIVRRHLNLVYSAALRTTGGDAHLAEDVCQAVFATLARQAPALVRHPVLTGWLYTTAHFTAAKIVRTECRRRAREQEAQAMQELLSSPTPAANWDRLRPAVDEVMQKLGERDRAAVLLRFFENRPFAEVGARLGLSENAARMRVERALEKLHVLLARRGITSTTAALAVFLAEHAVVAAPAGLAATVSSGALAGAAGGGGAFTLWSLMSTSKILTGIAGAAVIAVGTGVALQQQTTTSLRAEVASLQVQAQTVADLRAENQRLAKLQVPPDELERLRADSAEFDRLRTEWDALHARRPGPAQASAGTDAPPNPNGAPAYDMMQLDVQPRPIHQVAPVYPLAMRMDELPGEALISFIADTEGNVADATVVRASDPVFAEAALAAIRAWKFTPGQKGGRPVNARMQLPLVFTFSDEPANKR